jgi:hypothetical protein
MPEGRKCAYCGAEGTLTREHLWPQSLHRRVIVGAPDDHAGFWLGKIDKEIANEPTVRDVCAICNNTVLSQLDAYICQLYDAHLFHILKRNERVVFEYNYHLLKRWLLKMCFNSARINASIDAFVFPPLLPYILGKSTATGRDVQLYVQLAYPAKVPDNQLEPDDPRPLIYEPVVNRVGHFWFAPEGIGKKLLRAVHLRSYSFYLAFFDDTTPRKEHDFFSEVFLSLSREAKLLRASISKVELVCNGIDAWKSFSGSRGNKIVSASGDIIT